MAGAKVISSFGLDARVFALASMLGLTLSSSAEAQAVGQPKVVLGQPKETSATEYSIPVGCDAPRDRQSCIVQVSTDFAKFTGGNVVATTPADGGPATVTLAKARYYYVRAYFVQGAGGQGLQTSPYSNVVTYKYVAPAEPPPPPPAAVPTVPDASALGTTSCSGIAGITLKSGAVMPVGTSIESPNKRYQLIYQTDGNLVVYELLPTKKAVWAAGTMGANPGKVTMQADGNLVVSRADGAVAWSSKTGGNTGAVLSLQNDNNLVVYRKDTCQAAWARR